MAKIEFSTEVVKELAELLKASELGKLHLKNDDFEICVEAKKNPIVNASVPATVPALSGAANTAVSVGVKEEPQETGNLVTSPIIGTFYSAPGPDKDPYARIGQSVKKGDVLFIVESMKLMNEVQSEFDGIIKQIYVKNEEGVEYGQKIMLIE